MTTLLLLLALAGLLVMVGWAGFLLVSGGRPSKPPRHVGKSWCVNGLPSRPYAAR